MLYYDDNKTVTFDPAPVNAWATSRLIRTLIAFTFLFRQLYGYRVCKTAFISGHNNLQSDVNETN
jgi:hypothetical protein